MRMPAFPFATCSGISMLPATKPARERLSGQALDGVKETHIRARMFRHGKRCASLEEVWA